MQEPRPLSEKVILTGIRNVLGRREDVRIFRNSQAVSRDTQGNVFRSGLGTGTSDLVGWVRVDGKAVFLAIEAKTEKGRLTKEQTAFLLTVRRHGGCAFVARSVQEATQRLNAFISGMEPGTDDAG